MKDRMPAKTDLPLTPRGAAAPANAIVEKKRRRRETQQDANEKHGDSRNAKQRDGGGAKGDSKKDTDVHGAYCRRKTEVPRQDLTSTGNGDVQPRHLQRRGKFDSTEDGEREKERKLATKGGGLFTGARWRKHAGRRDGKPRRRVTFGAHKRREGCSAG
ncbi:hypothetical protein TGDOM2_365050 [Toxoplasma gondii GAB2-2007-GAL-DOM2]|uniref:Uncharacterized protein n=1 Tax=Toxoplasma gondii GAB2-2007-GAL-DOM2 TaxID=1130820 RepID=A0A086JPM8_TOXGO|nr:hypothetical protein TGDOM2_365050 [Toxoplasma gondii GAB2-2007-GAL-DOM2]